MLVKPQGCVVHYQNKAMNSMPDLPTLASYILLAKKLLIILRNNIIIYRNTSHSSVYL